MTLRNDKLATEMGKRNNQAAPENTQEQLECISLGSSNETIEICLAFDRNFVQHAAVTLLSASQSLSSTEKLIVHVLQAGDIGSEVQIAFENVAPDCTFHWYEIDVERFNSLPDNRDHVSLATYLRLFIPELLSEFSSRVIYLDCDTIVADELGKLWRQDLGSSPIAAAPDEGGLTQAKRLNLENSSFYFNAGVLVFDLEALDPAKYWQLVKTIVSDESINLELQDQDILNLAFKGRTHCLDLRWNANTRLFIPDDIEPAYTPEEALASALSPGILHFTDRKKPWCTNCNHPLRHLYWELRNQTPWRETTSKRFLRQVKNSLRNRFSKSRKAVNRVW